MSRTLLSATWIACAGLAACAATPPSTPLPSGEEVAAYVADNWDSYDYRVARGIGRPDERPTLDAVSNVECGYGLDVPECSFSVHVRFADGAPVTHSMVSSFDRHKDGALHEIFVIYHVRQR